MTDKITLAQLTQQARLIDELAAVVARQDTIIAELEARRRDDALTLQMLLTVLTYLAADAPPQVRGLLDDIRRRLAERDADRITALLDEADGVVEDGRRSMPFDHHGRIQ